ncbi:MAG: hypothetical protein M0Q91_18760 [Methanoregula sp.]|nr:hypothetical protein [Methanoregula sp.]
MPDADYIPFDMKCLACEYESICVIPLKLTHKLTRAWFRFLHSQGIIKRESYCRQGRKRRYSIQTHFKENPPEVQPIASILLDRRNEVLTV